jgi:hypothetical protein
LQQQQQQQQQQQLQQQPIRRVPSPMILSVARPTLSSQKKNSRPSTASPQDNGGSGKRRAEMFACRDRL